MNNILNLRGWTKNFLMVLVLVTTIAGCNLVNNTVDSGITALDDAIRRLETTSEEWQTIVKDLQDKLPKDIQSTIRSEVSDTLNRAIAAAGVTFQCSVDFVRQRVLEDLRRIKSELQGKAVPEKEPVFCHTVPIAIDKALVPDRLSHLEFYGYNFDKTTIHVILQDGNQQIDVSNFLDNPTHYSLTLNLGATGVQLSPNSRRFILKWDNREIHSIAITQPPPPPPTPIPVTITALKFTYWTTDEDKDNDGGHVGAEVLFNGQVVAAGPTEDPKDPDRVWKDETHHGPYDLVLSQPVPWSEVKNVSVAITHIRTGGSPAWRFRVEIDAVLSTGENRRVLNEYDPQAFFEHKPGNKRWWAFDLRGREDQLLKTQFFPIGPK